MFDECGSCRPAAAEAYSVRPEQSKAFGPAAPHTYGSPTWARAVLTATCAAAVGATTLDGGGVGGRGPGELARAGSGVRAMPAATATVPIALLASDAQRCVDVLVSVMPTVLLFSTTACRVS